VTWPALSPDDLFGVGNLPYGSFLDSHGRAHAAVRIGGQALSLTRAASELAPEYADLFADGTLDGFLAAGRPTWTRVRSLVTTWLTDETFRRAVQPLLYPLAGIELRLPFTVADYVDFYASEQHASNVGRIFRPGQPALTPNWKHMPVGYHGRSGTVVVSGTGIRRPVGQSRAADGAVLFGPSERLDIEAEVGFVVGPGSVPGEPVTVDAFADHVLGVCLVNDWSARDIQAWEYVPLGPFLGKSFATSIAAWITPLAALSAARVPAPRRDPAPLPYLDDSAEPAALDLSIEILLNGQVISAPPFAGMYWTAPQMLAHLTVNGAGLRPGDLFASGTVSGERRDQRGSLLELTWGGAEPIPLDDGTTRTFLQDGDEVSIRATAPGPGTSRIGLGEVSGRVSPARTV
jgi:fumarylacetoacetase